MLRHTSNWWAKAMRLFSHNPIYKKRARLGAILWTLLIFILCFVPARGVPDLDIPLIDKWVHFILFGMFSFLWLLSVTRYNHLHLLLVLISAIILGWLVEYLQGSLSFLGRSQDNMDTLADGIGGLIGVVVFYILNPKG
jgi:VanZ family protein